MIARPDERAVESEIQRDQQFRSNVGRGVSTAAAIGTGAITARVLPFLSKFIPTDLAMKGLSRVSPKVADFLKRGQSMGLNVEEGLQYLRDGIDSQQKKKEETSKDNRNLIEKYSPELHQFIMGEVKNGRSPLEAAAVATLGRKGDPDFRDIIKKLTKDYNAPWSDIIESVYGAERGNKTPNQPQQQQPPQGRQPFQGPGANQQPPQGQGNAKWDQIAATLQNLLKS